MRQNDPAGTDGFLGEVEFYTAIDDDPRCPSCSEA
jgi:hypothetical protein